MWTEVAKTGKGKKKAQPVNKDRFISKMYGGIGHYEDMQKSMLKIVVLGWEFNYPF
ncbi:unnamed protein product [Prunus armeniaca]|uniref:Uncharacterized protein n=1 Tax=Prunus armeniaca TaxID=36596 RepID=A0A6J5USL8_PRUAR|nr:unnamed protein product [Prunus armeniaca]CAB4310009.1 unnamed protein product [Prunus armeniaca]